MTLTLTIPVGPQAARLCPPVEQRSLSLGDQYELRWTEPRMDRPSDPTEELAWVESLREIARTERVDERGVSAGGNPEVSGLLWLVDLPLLTHPIAVPAGLPSLVVGVVPPDAIASPASPPPFPHETLAQDWLRLPVDSVELDARLRLWRRRLGLEPFFGDGPTFRTLLAVTEAIPSVLYRYRLWPDQTQEFLYTSQRSEAVFDLPVGISETPFGVWNYIHPDDREALTQSILEAAKGPSRWVHDARIMTRDGGVRFVRGISEPEPVADDGSVTWSGILVDRTQQIAQAQQLAQTRELQQAILDFAPFGVAVTRVMEQRSGADANPSAAADLANDSFDVSVDYVNPAAVRMLGPTVGLEGSRGLIESIVTPQDAPSIQERFRSALASSGPTELETTIHRPDGTARIVGATLVRLPDPRVETPRLLVLFQDITERRRLQADISSVADRTRQEVGQDLHDTVGQYLTGASMLVESLRNQLAAGMDPREADASLVRLREIIVESIDKVRRLSRALHPLRERSLRDLLQEVASFARDLYGLEVVLELSDLQSLEDPEAEVQLLNIVQESITNVARHAQASRVQISFDPYDAGGPLLHIEDNAVGLDPHRIGAGMGTRIMQYRAESIGWQVSFERSRNKSGTRVLVRPDLDRRSGSISD